MRYLGLDKFSFPISSTESVSLYERREPEQKDILLTIQITGKDQLDEIASRKAIYGENREDLAYKIFDANTIEFFDTEFDLNKINYIGITE